MKLLFICSSNVCRSAYSYFTFKRFIEEDDDLKKIVNKLDSAAVFNRSSRIFGKTAKTLLAEGYSKEDIDNFKPRYIKDHLDLFAEADIIIGMTKSHYMMLPKEYKAKYINLSEAAGHEYKAIPDPWLRLTQKRFNKDMKIIYDYLVEYKDILLKSNQ